MQTQDNIMKYESVLPEDFDGVFKFTNWSKEDFVGVWGGKEYLFPAEATSPMIMPEFSPLEIQHIRKKFAKNLAEREYFKSAGYKALKKQETNADGSPRLNSSLQAGTYSINELAPFIQKALEPLTVGRVTVSRASKTPVEDKLTRDEEGKLNTEAIDSKTSLRAKALNS